MAGETQPLAADDPATVAGYRIAGRLGAGGMGRVYLSHTPGGRPVAIKVIRPEFAENEEFRRRFRQEVHAARRVQGLFTASVVDADTEGPRPWLATAYVPGPALSAAVAEHGPFAPGAVLPLVAGVAEALQAIHAAGIVHRDLKPANVLLAPDGPRVIDFGIARAADAALLTGTGISLGTPAYMAPEQAVGRPVTGAADVFALGLVAAYAATGSPAFGEGTSGAVLYRIVHEDPDLKGLPDELRELVSGCLAKDPAERLSPAAVVAMCHALSGDTPLRQPERWVPDADADADADARAAGPAPGFGPAPAPYAPYTAMPSPAAPEPPPEPGPEAKPEPEAKPARGRPGCSVTITIAAAFAAVAVGIGFAVHSLNTGSAKSSADGGPAMSAPGSVAGSAPAYGYQALTLPDGSGLALSDDPPRVRKGGGDLVFRVREGLTAGRGSVLSLLGAQDESTEAACGKATRQALDPVPAAGLAAGARICVVGHDGETGLVTVRSVQAAGLTVDVVVWPVQPQPSGSSG
ncbi:serine/threonine protein kinase [Streptomyces sp. NBC_01537]|uniref:serine/threonine-protein kinase n=1 Tax=Streptomyces sp. NBC_01537 TaxID=2903896 RepID=UPI003865C5AB